MSKKLIYRQLHDDIYIGLLPKLDSNYHHNDGENLELHQPSSSKKYVK
ncbi:MAG: hypothetical protein HN820_08430 [Candidatus Marinimicrobia bacterium]|nr:hypothetical protein [Candidatus Neomarinimicrobiota bacterium]MBT7378165.1 hypothetical protein [Candidatus Neomarinimicrobiota bacterium]